MPVVDTVSTVHKMSFKYLSDIRWPTISMFCQLFKRYERHSPKAIDLYLTNALEARSRGAQAGSALNGKIDRKRKLKTDKKVKLGIAVRN